MLCLKCLVLVLRYKFPWIPVGTDTRPRPATRLCVILLTAVSAQKLVLSLVSLCVTKKRDITSQQICGNITCCDLCLLGCTSMLEVGDSPVHMMIQVSSVIMCSSAHSCRLCCSLLLWLCTQSSNERLSSAFCDGTHPYSVLAPFSRCCENQLKV